MVVVLIVAGLLGTAVGAAETMGRRYAEEQIATRVRQQLGLDVVPTATIVGSPFVTQAVQRRFDEVHVTSGAGWLATAGGIVQISSLDLELHGLSLDADLAGAVIDSIDGQVVVPWSGAGDLVDADLRFAGRDDQGRGRVSISRTLDLQGLQLPITVTGRPDLDAEQRLVLSEPALAVSGITLPAVLVTDLLSQQLTPVALPLPAGVRIDTLVVDDAGMVLTVSGGRTVLG